MKTKAELEKEIKRLKSRIRFLERKQKSIVNHYYNCVGGGGSGGSNINEDDGRMSSMGGYQQKVDSRGDTY